MKQILSIIGSMKTMAVFMLIFAFAIGYATFLENDFGTQTAKADIYNALWFEILMAVLTVNLVINMFRFKMFSLKKAPIFLFHFSFLVIVLGAAITRFIGFEGTMHIREGESGNAMLSADSFMKVNASLNGQEDEIEQQMYLSKKSQNSFSADLKVDGKVVSVKLANYIPDAIEKLSEGKSGGVEIIDMMVTDGESSSPVRLRRGEAYENSAFVIDFDSKKMFLRPVISVSSENGELFIKHDMALKYLKMDDKSEGIINPSAQTKLATRTLFGANGANFVVRKFYAHAASELVRNPEASPMDPQMDALVFNVSVDGKAKDFTIFGQSGRAAKDSSINIDGVEVKISYGSKKLTLPFFVKLNDFQLDRYPGSMSPASYASEVELIDKEQGINMPYRIYMNHILEHRGYRFFQSSYDQDEGGTILSVNHDPGTLPSYIGYFLLGVGMFWSLISRHNRFEQLNKKARNAAASRIAGLLAVLVLATSPNYADDLDPAIKTVLSFDKNHAQKFGELVVQDSAGRMKPMDTLSREILAKVYRDSKLHVGNSDLDANQVVLGMMSKPDAYRELKIIKTNNETINKLIGARADAKYASFAQFFINVNELAGYKLGEYVEKANQKEPKHRDQFDKMVLEVDERVNICYSVYSGALMKFWPKPNDINNKWYPTIDALQTFDRKDALRIRDVAFLYFTALDKAVMTGVWSEADTALVKLVEYQKFYGKGVYPTQEKINAEMFYNKANIFERIYPLYFVLGFFLLIASFVKVLKPSFNISVLTKLSLVLLVVLFVAHTGGIALRWFVAGHAPWSDGYESMIYISWATVLAGFIFANRSSFAIASTAILTGLILFVAHLNWMNPQVTNLVPVLNSYWLSIHVAVITASYGFLGLGALLGFITLVLFVLKNSSNDEHISASIKELNAINEMSLMIGLAFLTLGNFLGGVWANESWGRYWGWDPKETWALVTILVYAVVVHLRFIKALYSEFNYSVISLLSYTSVIMTYFGVNYYLAGMHSYAKGDPVPIPDFVPITYAVIFVLIAIAFRNRKLV